MVQVLKTEYWSKADAFLLPMTGLPKEVRFEQRSFLFWKGYSIEDYKLVLTYEYNNYEEFLIHCREEIFPILDRKGYLVESYDLPGKSIFVLDISEWAADIEQFLAGKYSKFSKEAKYSIEKFHTFNRNQIPIYIYAVLYPGLRMALLREDGKDMNPIEYVAKNYGLDLEELEKIGEIGSSYNVMDETLLTDVDDFCNSVRFDE